MGSGDEGMDTINLYIPSIYSRLLDTESLLYQDIRYYFQLAYEDGYYLKMVHGLAHHTQYMPIPDQTIQAIVADYKTEPKRALYLINKHLLPLKHALIESALPSPTYKCLDTMLTTANGYMEKDGDIKLFFGSGDLAIDPFTHGQNASFTLNPTVRLNAEEQNIYFGRSAFVAYHARDCILRYNVLTTGRAFVIMSIEKASTMQYLTLYENGKSASYIYDEHTNPRRKILKNILKR